MNELGMTTQLDKTERKSDTSDFGHHISGRGGEEARILIRRQSRLYLFWVVGSGFWGLGSDGSLGYHKDQRPGQGFAPYDRLYHTMHYATFE